MRQEEKNLILTSENGVIIHFKGAEFKLSLQDAPEKMTWNAAMEYAKEQGGRLPTKEELMWMYLNKDEINKALVGAGGEPLKDDWYWSSTEYESYGAWGLGFLSGSVDWYFKNGNVYVRPVLAFNFFK